MAVMGDTVATATLRANLGRRAWRICKLYHVLNEDGQPVIFQPRPAQMELYNTMWYRNVICKARKLGYSTLIDLLALDLCLFNHNMLACIICDNQYHAQDLFRRNVRHPYESLPRSLRLAVPLLSDSKTEMEFSNGSLISTGVTVRSGTPQFLHVSEFGRICAVAPDKAREIVTGSLEAVSATGDQMVFVESTAKGRAGYFYEMCKVARSLQESNQALSRMDYRFHFAPWYRNPANVDPSGSVVIRKELREYFEGLAAKGITLTAEQEGWYAKKHRDLGPDMLAEHPSTPDEAFEAGAKGHYYEEELRRARVEGRISDVPRREGIPVDTWWDLGRNTMAIWFTQTIGNRVNVIEYLEPTGNGLPAAAGALSRRSYRYGVHHAPHDIVVTEIGSGKTRMEMAAELGIRFRTVPRVQDKADSIEAARRLFEYCWFDEGKCGLGLERLEGYRKEWDERRADWREEPFADINSHGADAFQCLGMGHAFGQRRMEMDDLIEGAAV